MSTLETNLKALTPDIFSALLTKLNVRTPKAETKPAEKNKHWQNCYAALQNSLLYMNKFEGIDPTKVTVSYENKTILNITSNHGGTFISLFSLDYPCSCCHMAVTDEDDKTGNGLKCATCKLYWHNECGGPDYTILPDLFQALKNAPPNVSIYCPMCMVNNKAVTLVGISDKVEKLQAQSPQDYPVLSSSSVKDISSKNSRNRVVSGYASADQFKRKMNEEKDRVERTRLVRKPKGIKLSTSKLIRKSFNMDYRGVMIRDCRLPAGGSILLEFENKQAALKMDTDWKDHSFGGNEGLYNLERETHAGIVQHIEAYQEGGEDEEVEIKESVLTETEILEEVKKTYPAATCEVFMRKNSKDEKVPTGTVKIKFASRDELENAMRTSIYMFSQRLAVEEFQFKPRVIKCHNCQMFGHIAMRCKRPAKCGCCSEAHSSKACPHLSNRDKFKCAHCTGKHFTGDKSCKKFQAKEDELKDRLSYGY